MTEQPAAPTGDSAGGRAVPGQPQTGSDAGAGRGVQRRSHRLRWVSVVVAAVLVIILGSVAAAAAVITRAPAVGSFADAAQGQWSTVQLPAPAKNGDGSPYDIFVKPGSSDNLMIFFGDGGLNWNEETATQPITLTSSIFGGGNYYADNVPFYEVNTFRGVLATGAPNPFADFTIVYIPTTTGDLAIGDTVASTTAKSGQNATSTFNGFNNARAALDWVYSSVASPAKVLVAGAGTGGLSSAIWLSDVGAHYSTQPLFQFSDSGYLTAQSFPAVIDPVWRSEFESRFGFEPTANPLSAAVDHNHQQFGSRLTTLLLETTLDKVSANYSALLDDGFYSPQSGSDWNYSMKSAFRALVAVPTTTGPPSAADPGLAVSPPAVPGSATGSAATGSASDGSAAAGVTVQGPAATVFLTDFGADSHGETPHNLSLSGDFASVTQDGVTLVSWLTSAVLDGRPQSVGAALLEQ